MSSLLKKWIFPIAVEFDNDKSVCDSLICDDPKSPSSLDYDDCSESLGSKEDSPKLNNNHIPNGDSKPCEGTETLANNLTVDEDPEYWITALRNCNADSYKLLTSLKHKISTSRRAWIKEFLELNGFQTILETLDTLIEGVSQHPLDSDDTLELQLECAKCLRTLVDTGQGLRFLAHDTTGNLAILMAKALQTTSCDVKTLILELLTALCLFNEQGHKSVLLVLQHYREIVSRSRSIFTSIMKDLKDESTTVVYKHTLLCFINGLIMGLADMKTRNKMRNELIGLGITHILYELKLQGSEEIQYQCEVFEESRLKDKDNLYGFDINDHHELFHTIYHKVYDTPNSASFLAILQTLWQIDDGKSSDQVWDILETLTRKIVLMNNPGKAKFFVDNVIPYLPLTQDGRPGSRDIAVQTENRFPPSSSIHYHRSFKFGGVPPKKYQPQLNVTKRRSSHHRSWRHLNEGMNASCQEEELNDTAISKEIYSDLTSHDLSISYDYITPPDTPANSKNDQSTNTKYIKVAPNSTKSSKKRNVSRHRYGTKSPFNRSLSTDSLLGQQHRDDSFTERLVNVTASDEASERAQTPIPIPPPLPRPPCTSSQSPLSNNIPASGSSKLNTPYRTPNLTPLSNGPVEGVGPLHHSNSFKCPPPLPLPPWNDEKQSTQGVNHHSGRQMKKPNRLYHEKVLYPLSPLETADTVEIMPQALCVPRPKHRMKTLNWTKLPVSVVQSKDSIWSRVLTNQSYLKINYDEIEELFSISSRESPLKKRNSNSKDSSEIIFLEHKRSMNVNILLKQFKMPLEHVLAMIKEVKGKTIGSDRLRGLLNVLPDKNEVSLLKNFDGDVTKLGMAEQFYYHLIHIPNYAVLIKAMLLKEEFFDNAEILEKQICMVIKTCEELMTNKNLEKFLLLVLKIGNFFNANNYAGNALGFKVSFLCKLMDTRSKTPRVTLLHYLLEVAQGVDPNIVEFPNELSTLRSVQKLSIESLYLEINEMTKSVQKLVLEIEYSNKDIKNNFNNFVELALKKSAELKDEIDTVPEYIKKLAERYCEDETKFNLQEFFIMFTNFCEKVEQARKENIQRKIMKENEAKRKARQNVTISRSSKTSLDEPESENMVEKLLAEIKRGDFKLQKRSSNCSKNSLNGTEYSDLSHHLIIQQRDVSG